MRTADRRIITNPVWKHLGSCLHVTSELTTSRKHDDEVREQLIRTENENQDAYVQAVQDSWNEDKSTTLGLDSFAVQGHWLSTPTPKLTIDSSTEQ